MENLECPVCLEPAKEAVECTQCAQIFCEACTKPLKKCPMCRADSSFKESAFARKLINNLPKKCDYCDFTTTAAEMKYHLVKCDYRDFYCNVCSAFSGKKPEFVQHLLSAHNEDLLNTFTYNPDVEKHEKVVWENKTRFLRHSVDILTTQTGIKSYNNVSVQIRLRKAKNAAFIVLGFSDKPLHLAKGFLGGDIGSGNWGLAGNGALGEEGKWKRADSYKEGDIITLNFHNKVITYKINGKHNDYSFKFSKSSVYLACSMYYNGDELEIIG